MTQSRLYPEPPQVDATFYFSRADGRKNIGAVCECLERAGVERTGEVDIVRSVDVPIFGLISDLLVEKHDDDVKDEPERDEKGIWIMRRGYRDKRAGDIVVQYGMTMDLAPAGEHPVVVTASGGSLGTNDFLKLKNKQREAATRVADGVLSLFKDICQHCEVLYGAIMIERQLPSPRELAKGEEGLGADLFVSRRLMLAHPQLTSELDRLFAGHHDDWRTGSFWAGSSYFNPERRSIVLTSEARRKVATSVANALRSASRS